MNVNSWKNWWSLHFRKFSSNLKNPSCLSPKSQRSPKQLRFQIPEVLLIEEKVDIHSAIRNRISNEMGSNIEEKRGE